MGFFYLINPLTIGCPLTICVRASIFFVSPLSHDTIQSERKFFCLIHLDLTTEGGMG